MVGWIWNLYHRQGFRYIRCQLSVKLSVVMIYHIPEDLPPLISSTPLVNFIGVTEGWSEHISSKFGYKLFL